MNFSPRDLIYAWLIATVFSGLPSTLHAFATGGDPLEATRAAGYAYFGVTDNSRGFVFNADIVSVIRFLDIGTRPSTLR